MTRTVSGMHICEGMQLVGLNEQKLLPSDMGLRLGAKPGHVIQCESCGRTWVAISDGTSLGAWRHEGKWERRRRERRARKITWWRQ